MTKRPTTKSSGPSRAAGAQLGVILTLSLVCATVLWRSGAGARSLSLTDPAQFVTGCIRIAGLIMALWLGSVTVLAVALQLVGARLASRLVERLLPSMIRRLVHLSCGVTIVGVLMGGPAGASVRYPGPTSTTQLRNHAVVGDPTNGQRWPEIDPVPVSSSPPRAPLSIPSGGVPSIPTSRRPLPVTPAPTTPAPITIAHAGTVVIADTVPASSITVGAMLGGASEAAEHSPKATAGSQPQGVGRPGKHQSDAERRSPSTTVGQEARQWTVQRGDHFWNIADRVVTAAHPGATEHHIARYWLSLIEVNRSRLDDPHNPDLLRIGTHLLIPDPSP